MLNLHFAPSLNRLVPVLLEKLRKVWTDPFLPPALIVPSPAVGKWLTMRLADSPVLGLGCIAGLEFLTLERFLWDILRPADSIRLLDAAVLGQVICALLDDDLLDGPCYGPVSAYLKNRDKTIDPVKRVQLSSRIARQFQEYEFNRPSVWEEEKRRWKNGIDAAWLDGMFYKDDRSEEAVWQKDLYCKAHGRLERAGASGNVHYLSLPHLYRRRRENGPEDNAQWALPPDNIFLFGVSKVSHFHRNTLVEISRMAGVEMQVYLTNPCAEFWEDVDTRRNRGRIRRRWKHDSGKEEAGITAREPGDYEKSELEDFAHLPEDPALLELWGRAGKENIYLWCPLAEWNFDYYCPPEAEQGGPPETLLKALQKALLRREKDLPGPAGGGTWKNDGSLQVLACPDPAREVEELREQVLDLIAESKKNGPCLRLNDIAVYLPDPGAYLAQVHRVFGAFSHSDPGYIPYTMLGAPGSDSLFAQGMHTLLEIIDGRFDRARVFALLRNPIVQATRDIAPDNVAVWEGWAEELGIFRGFNKEHREQMGDGGQTITDVHTFELGMARLLLGNLAAGPVELGYRLLIDDENKSPPSIPPFRDFDTSDADSVERFCGLVEDLYTDTVRLTGLVGRAPLSESVDAMAGLALSWFGIVPEDMAAEELVLRGFRDALRAVKLQKDLAARETIAEKKEVIALVKECLPEELPAGSKAWTGGITFAPLRPAMVVPHRVIFALGLGATAFPGTNETPTWDLLSRKRIVGDSDRVRDNRFAFLELLHAAQERLVLSFRARNMQKEEALQPSSVLLELESYLKDQGLKIHDEENKEDRCLIRRDVPWIVHESLDEIIKDGRKHGSWDGAEVRLARLEGVPGAKRSPYRYKPGGRPPADNKQGHVRTTVNNLRKYFANPLEYHLSKTLGIEFDEQPGTMGATDEPLKSGFLEMLTLRRAIWTELLGKVFPEKKDRECPGVDALCDEAGKIARKVHDDYLIRGGSPEAQFCIMERRHLVAWAQVCVEPTLDLVQEFSGHKLVRNVDLSLKRPGFRGELKVDMGNGKECSVGCRHGLALVPLAWDGTCNDRIGIISIKNAGTAKNRAADNPDLWLQGTMQWLAENADEKSDLSKAPLIRLLQLDTGNSRVDRCSVRRFEEPNHRKKLQEVREWLRKIVDEMLFSNCSDHLPFKIIQKLFTGEWKSITRELVEDKLSDDEFGYKSFLEAFKLVEVRVPEGDICALVQARFKPMLEGWIHE